MAYADSIYYTETYKGAIVPGDQLDQLLATASDDIDSLTFNRIGGSAGLPALNLFQQDKIRRAVCMQADFQEEYGDLLNNPLASYGINGVSMSFDANRIVCYDGIYTTKRVYALLQQTGLTYRGLERRRFS